MALETNGGLLPCPFCGGDTTFWTRPMRDGYFAWIECDVCGAKTKCAPTSYSVEQEEFWSEIGVARIIAYWNRRTG